MTHAFAFDSHFEQFGTVIQIPSRNRLRSIKQHFALVPAVPSPVPPSNRVWPTAHAAPSARRAAPPIPYVGQNVYRLLKRSVNASTEN